MSEQETQGQAAQEQGQETGYNEQADAGSSAVENQGDAPARSIEFILDLPLKVTVELGRTKMVVNDFLQLAQGSIIELEKQAGDPLEVMVNEKLIARGEVVEVEDKFGIRITDIITPTERIEKLG